MKLPELPKRWLKNKEVWSRAGLTALRRAEFPTESTFSFPVPTHRTGSPAYAVMLSPVLQYPGQPEKHEVPDRWLLLDANTGSVLLYAKTSAQAFGEGGFAAVTLPFPTLSQEEMQRRMENAEACCDAISLAFWQQQPVDRTQKAAFSAAFEQIVPDELRPRYAALAPDFFAWLKN